MNTVTAADVYALGLALGAILRDVDPVKRDAALNLVRTLEAQAAGGHTCPAYGPCPRPECGEAWR